MSPPVPLGKPGPSFRVLYVAYWGATEPLGQSLVVPVLASMAACHVQVSLVSFEKPSDMAIPNLVRETRERLGRHGVVWAPVAYHKRPRVPATLFDMVNGWRQGIAVGLRSRAQVVHARTFVGGLVGHAVARTLSVPFVYHNEGFYPDEQVDAGVWRAGSLSHRLAKALESRLYAHADGIIALSDRARDILCASREVRRKGTPVIVVPSAIDVSRFRPRPFAPLGQRTLRLVYLGGVGARYKLEAAVRFAAAVDERHPCHLQIYTAHPEIARAIVLSTSLKPMAWSVGTLQPAEVPSALREEDAGLSFLVRGLSEHGGSPTKVGEYWAAGLPAITTATIGDVGDIILRERVGIILDGDGDRDFSHAATRLVRLLDDPDLPARCRRAAETHYSATAAAERQLLLYQTLLGRLNPRGGL